MLRKTVRVEISDQLTVECKEVTWRQVKDIMSKILPENLPATGWIDYFGKIISNDLLPITTNLTFDNLLDLTPSETAAIYAAIKEANADFLASAEALQLPKVLKEVQNLIVGKITAAVNDAISKSIGV